VIEDHCLVGVGAVIMDGAVIGKGSIVAGGACVVEGSVFPPHAVIAGVPAKQIRDWLYHRNAQHTKRGEHRAWTGPEFEAWREGQRARVEADRDL
jgi:carbonic anhydrase/acetyltransferase-like protein (isoleucine patch superfamily)